MRLAVRAQTSLYWLSVFHYWVFVSIWVKRSFQVVKFEIKGVSDVVPKGSIPTFGGVLVFWHEQSLRAHQTRVHPNILRPPILACKRSFITHALSHVKLQRGKFFLKIIFSFFKQVAPPLFKMFQTFPSLRFLWFDQISFVLLDLCLLLSWHGLSEFNFFCAIQLGSCHEFL